MVVTLRRLLFVAGLIGAVAPVQAATSIQIRPSMTYANSSDIAMRATNGAYTGVGSVFISFASTAPSGAGALCTGALLSSNVVVTAGHCFGATDASGNPDAVVGVSFYAPSFDEATPATTYSVASYQVNPGFTGDLTQGGDFALLTLSKAVTGAATYRIYGGDPLQTYTQVGTGATGGPSGIDPANSQFVQRAGSNMYEFFGNQLDSSLSGNLLLADLDDGTTTHDAFGRLLGETQLGVPGESLATPGDSGAPAFINGEIVSLASFAFSADAFRNPAVCGDSDSIDPYSAGGECTNYSVGEIGFDTWLAPYKAEIESYVTTAGNSSAVPEPSTWAQLMAGMGLAGFMLRRRRSPAMSIA